MKQKILVTGSNGFIGQKIMDQLLDRQDIELIALSLGENRYPHPTGYLYIDGDVCDAAKMNAVLMAYRPDFIIHTVAKANVDECEADVASCKQVNVDPVRQFIELAEKYPFHLIHLSTDFVFDGLDGPYTETDQPKPLNEYGKSKLAAERLLQDSTMDWTIVRTILVYGAPHEVQRSNLMLWVKRSLEDGKKIKVVTDHFRMPTLVEDLAIAILKIMDQRATGIYHISGEEGYSVYEIAQSVAHFWQLDATLLVPVHSSSFPLGVARPSHTGFVLDKAKNYLNFKPRSLQAGLQLMREQLPG